MYGIPGFGGHFGFGGRRGRDFAEVAVGHVFDFVVVVENHAAEAGHTEVFVEHVAGEDVGRSQLFQGETVVDDRRRLFLRIGLLHKEVERLQAVFDVGVFDDNHVFGFFNLAGGEAAHFGEKGFVAARFGQRDVGKLHGVGHASDAVVFFHQQVFLPHVFAVEVFVGAEGVFDDFEHIGEGGQGEHAHHQPFHAGREDEFVVGIAQVLGKLAPEDVFALLVQAEQGVEIAVGAHRQHFAQKTHIAAGHGHVDEKIGAGEGEKHGNLFRVEQRGVDFQTASSVVHHRQREGMAAAAVDDAAEDIGRFVAVEGRIEHLDVQVQFLRRPFRAEVPPRRAHDVRHVGRRVGEGNLPVEMAEYAAQAAAQAGFGGVVGGKHRRIGVDEFGADGRFDKDKAVVEIRLVQHLGRHRIEKRLGQLGLLVVDQQRDVFLFHLRPQILRRPLRQALAQNVRRLAHAAVVHLDALRRQILYPLPVAALEQRFGLRGFFAEQAVVFVETGQHGFGGAAGAALLSRHLVLLCV